MPLFHFCELKRKMRIPRIYHPQNMLIGQETLLDERSAHYLTNVLRMREGGELTLFNGKGDEFSGSLIALDRKKATVMVKSQCQPNSESTLHTTLGIGLSRGERMDYVVQKSTELGVSVIQPLFTEFCEVKLDAKRSVKKIEHWVQVSISACEQSGRVVLPEIREPQSIQDWLKTAPTCQHKFLLDQSQPAILSTLNKPETVALLIGPEGGFSDKEKTLALDQGFMGLNLGSRTLRTETAPIAALSLFQFLWGS